MGTVNSTPPPGPLSDAEALHMVRAILGQDFYLKRQEGPDGGFCIMGKGRLGTMVLMGSGLTWRGAIWDAHDMMKRGRR